MPHAIALGALVADLERLLGSDHLDSWTARSSLAAAYQAAGRADEAIQLFEQTLVARVRLLGPDHPDTLSSHSTAWPPPTRLRAGPTRRSQLFEQTLVARVAVAGSGSSQYPGVAEQSRERLPGYRAPRRGGPAVRVDPGRL